MPKWELFLIGGSYAGRTLKPILRGQAVPVQKDAIHQFFMENEDFKMICEDYRLCSEALKGWNQSESEEAPARRKEYADLLQGLELEISQILNEHT